MTDRPILFSAPMVRALLEGRKTQTRRLAYGKSRPMPAKTPRVNLKMNALCTTYSPASIWQKVEPGDRLWVRETWCGNRAYDNLPPRRMPVDGPLNWAAGSGNEWPSNSDMWGKTRVSIHMPRWASRLTLVVKDVRRQKLQDINNADAIEEGCGGYLHPDSSRMTHEPFPCEVFRDLWRSLHGDDAWDDNPEIVALTFTIHKRNIDEATT